VANGDITSVKSPDVGYTGADAVMIGRAARAALDFREVHFLATGILRHRWWPTCPVCCWHT
jgi:tRNA-dihydrouridine synthase